MRAEKMTEEFPRLLPLLGRFGELDELAKQAGFPAVDGVVLDIGVSSFQIDEAGRGFSFQKDGPLDMRMGAAGVSAADVVNQMAERDLANVIFRLGEEKNSRRIARAIVDRRGARPFLELPIWRPSLRPPLAGAKARVHPATQTFRAIRMYVNDELGELARGLSAAERVLKPGGRLVMVTFHSLEDRLVKTRCASAQAAFRPAQGMCPSSQSRSPRASRRLQTRRCNHLKRKWKPIHAHAQPDCGPWSDGCGGPGGPADDGMDLPPISELEVMR